MSSAKRAYQAFLDSRDDIGFHHQIWWLDAACGSNSWDVALIYDAADTVIGAWPYYIEQKMGLTLLRQAILTPYLGPLLSYPHNMKKQTARIAYDKKQLTRLYGQLPRYTYLNQNIYPKIRNLLPLYWRGMSISGRYGYTIDLSKNLDTIHAGLEGAVRTQIRKASSLLTLHSTEDTSRFFELTKMSFDHHRDRLPYSDALMTQIVTSATERGQGELLIVKDSEDRWHAGAFLVFDLATVYTILIGSHPVLRQSGAVQMLIWQIIKRYHERAKMLDFCGSMIERIEPIFRSFGAQQQEYYQLSHAPTLWYQLASTLRNWWQDR